MSVGVILESLQEQLAITVAWLPFLLAVTIGTMGILTMNVPFMMFTAGLLGTLLGATALGKFLHVVTNFASLGRVPLLLVVVVGVIGIITIGAMGILSMNAQFMMIAGILLGIVLGSAVLGKLLNIVTDSASLGRVPLWTPAPRCGVMPPVIPGDLKSVSIFVPSAWVMAVSFMLMYIFLAGAEMLRPGGLPPWITDGNHPEELQNARNTAVKILFTVGIVALWIILHRIFLTGCESPIPAILGLAFGTSAAYGWYKVAQACPRWIADIFGITARYPPAAATFDGEAECSAV